MEDIIYFIIFAIITLVITVVKSGQNKKQQQISSSNFDEFSLDENLEETSDAERLKAIRLTAIKEQFEKIKQTKDAVEDTYRSNEAYQIDGSDSLDDKTMNSSEKTYNSKYAYSINNNNDRINLVENFDIRDAIIYSEILNAKYID